jgi:predicted nucleic acid-binding protein
VAALLGLPIEYASPTAVTADAWALAETLGWAKTYDAEYIALARAVDAPLVTADQRLVRGASHLATILGPADPRL